MGELYLGKAPHCPVHGGMKRFPDAFDMWMCVGFDGEGCDYTAEIQWTRLEDHIVEKGSLGLGDVIEFGVKS